MANNLGGYDLTIFVQEALRFLRLRLGIGARIHRGYSPNPQQKGSSIRIPVRGTFQVEDAPSDAQDIDASSVSVPLDNWKEVKFALPDDEGQYAMESIIADHIEPAAYALASYIDGSLAGQYVNVPWHSDLSVASEAALRNSIVMARKQLADNGAPVSDLANLHLAVDHTLEADLLKSDFMSMFNVTGGTVNQASLLQGFLGQRFGLNMHAHGFIPTHTSGTVISAGTDNVGTLNGNHSKGATAIAVAGFDGTETFVAGDAFVIAGNAQRYVVTANQALTGGGATIQIFPALAQDYTTGAVVTFEDDSSLATSFRANLAYHRDFAALATAPLESQQGSNQARQQGIQVETIVDPETRIALRGRMWYDPDLSQLVTAFDILYGIKVLNPNLAVRLRGATS